MLKIVDFLYKNDQGTASFVQKVTSRCESQIIGKVAAFPANSHLFKFSNKSSRKIREICLKLITKTPERRH